MMTRDERNAKRRSRRVRTLRQMASYYRGRALDESLADVPREMSLGSMLAAEWALALVDELRESYPSAWLAIEAKANERALEKARADGFVSTV